MAEERPDKTDDDPRFDLQQMLQDVQAESARNAQGPVKQSDILKMFQNRKPPTRDSDG